MCCRQKTDRNRYCKPIFLSKFIVTFSHPVVNIKRNCHILAFTQEDENSVLIFEFSYWLNCAMLYRSIAGQPTLTYYTYTHKGTWPYVKLPTNLTKRAADILCIYIVFCALIFIISFGGPASPARTKSKCAYFKRIMYPRNAGRMMRCCPCIRLDECGVHGREGVEYCMYIFNYFSHSPFLRAYVICHCDASNKFGIYRTIRIV